MGAWWRIGQVAAAAVLVAGCSTGGARKADGGPAVTPRSDRAAAPLRERGIANVPVNVHVSDPTLSTDHDNPGAPIETIVVVRFTELDTANDRTVIVEPVLWENGRNQAGDVLDGLTDGKYTVTVKAKARSGYLRIRTKAKDRKRGVISLRVYPDGKEDEVTVDSLAIND